MDQLSLNGEAGPGDRPRIIGVLSPMIGAAFFSSVISGIIREADLHGAKVVAIQTFDPGTADMDNAFSRFWTRVGWKRFDGVIDVVNAVDDVYLAELAGTGMPIVHISNDVPGLDCPVVSSDNYGGVVAAVEHLISHGHSRIAFVGCLEQNDIQERYTGYLDALSRHDIPFDQTLVFETPNLTEPGGRGAASAMIAKGMPSTAAFVATDFLAFGLSQELQHAGYKLPADLAIIAFDDTEMGSLRRPALSTVHQDMAEIGSEAVRLILQRISGEILPATSSRIPTSLITRTSCGCSSEILSMHNTWQSDDADGIGELSNLLKTSLANALTAHSRAGKVSEDFIDNAISTIVAVLFASGDNFDYGLLDEVASVAEQLCSYDVRFELLTNFIAKVRSIAGSVLKDLNSATLERNLSRVSRAFSTAYARSEVYGRAELYFALRSEYRLSLDLMHSPEESIAGLHFLTATDIRAAYLGLWQNQESETDLVLANSYTMSGLEPLPEGGTGRAEDFPPLSLALLSSPANSEITMILPVRTATRDWGLLAIVGPVEETVVTGRDFYFQCAALLSMALEQVSLLSSLRTQGEELRSSEERYALAARAVNDGLWDWDFKTDKIYLSERWQEVVGVESGTITTSPREWLDRVHLDDLRALEVALDQCKSGQSSALESEHRIRFGDGSYRWVHCRAIALPGTPHPATRLVGSITDITDRRRLEDQLRHQALHDTLTGLPNRTLVLDRADRMLAAARRRHGAVSALFIDLDNFKEVNDGFGHAAGDELLVSVAARLKRAAREADTVGRLGGDEFVILVYNGDSPAVAAMVAERVREVLRPPFHVNGHDYLVGASIGIGTTSNDTAESLLQDADVAMYQAKTAGKNQVVVFQPVMQRTAHQRIELELGLAAAIAEHQLRVHYQPIYDLESHQLRGMEALVRWQHPERGLLAPGEFIPLAETSGRLIIDIGRYVLSEACQTAAEWHDAGNPIDIAVNLSARQLENDEIVSTVAEVLAESGLNPSNLILEVTETAMMHDAEAVVKRMGRLKALGVRIAIDDFGSGYSSLTYLRRFPVDVLKIDRSFITSIAESPEDASVVQTLVALGRILELEVVAEGVELESQLAMVEAVGCDAVQGFLLSRPLDATKMKLFFAERVSTAGYELTP